LPVCGVVAIDLRGTSGIQAGSGKVKTPRRAECSDQKAFPMMAIITPAVPPHKVLTTISRINVNPPLQLKLLRCPIEAGFDKTVGMVRLPGRMICLSDKSALGFGNRM
jgi:hypothetical protein